MPPPSLPTPASVAARALYLYENIGAGLGDGQPMAPDDVMQRALYLVVNEGIHGHPVGGEPLDADDVLARALYLYVSRATDRDPTDVALRALYAYVAYTATEVFPWIEKIVPNEQFPLGTVDVYGDGFGDTPAAEGGQVLLNALLMGVVSWSARSPGLHPGAGTTQAALTVSVPAAGVSGPVTVELTL